MSLCVLTYYVNSSFPALVEERRYFYNATAVHECTFSRRSQVSRDGAKIQMLHFNVFMLIINHHIHCRMLSGWHKIVATNSLDSLEKIPVSIKLLPNWCLFWLVQFFLWFLAQHHHDVGWFHLYSTSLFHEESHGRSVRERVPAAVGKTRRGDFHYIDSVL